MKGNLRIKLCDKANRKIEAATIFINSTTPIRKKKYAHNRKQFNLKILYLLFRPPD